jgi:hypothetical protein
MSGAGRTPRRLADHDPEVNRAEKRKAVRTRRTRRIRALEKRLLELEPSSDDDDTFMVSKCNECVGWPPPYLT